MWSVHHGEKRWREDTGPGDHVAAGTSGLCATGAAVVSAQFVESPIRSLALAWAFRRIMGYGADQVGLLKPTGEMPGPHAGGRIDDPGKEKRAYPLGREGQLGGQVGLPEKGRS